MKKLLALGFLSFYFANSFLLPAHAKQPNQAGSSLACKKVDLLDIVVFPTAPLPNSERKRLWGERQAEIAIEFFRADRPDRASEINDKIASELGLSPGDRAALATIQNLEAGKSAIVLLPSIENPSRYAKAFSVQLEKLPLQPRREWVLKAVEELANYDSSLQTQKISWLLDLAVEYQKIGNQTEVLNLLEKARSRLEKAPVRAWIKVAEGYRKVGKLDIARSLLAPLPDQIKATSFNQVDGGAENFANLGHQLIRLGQTQQGLVYIAEAEKLLQQKIYSRNQIAPLFQAYAAAGQSSKAIELIRSLNKYEATYAYANLAKYGAEIGDERLAQQGLRLIRTEWMVNSTSSEVVGLFAKAGKFEAAQRIAMAMTQGLERLDALAAIVYTASQSNQPELSQKLVAEMRQVRSSALPDNNIIQVIDALIEAGDRTYARQLLKALDQTKNRFALAKRYTQIEDFETANQLLDAEHEFQKSHKTPLLPQFRNLIEPFLPILPLSRSPLQEFFDAALTEPLPVRQSVPPILTPKVKQSQKHPSTQQKDSSDRIILREMFANSYAAARNFAKASSSIVEIPDQYCYLKIRTWNNLMREAVKAGELKMALDALQKSDRLSKRAKLENSEFLRSQLVAIARLYSQRNQLKEAAQLLEFALLEVKL